MTTDTAAELEQFFFYLKIYAKDTHSFIRHAMETGTAGEINASNLLPDLKKWEGNFREAIRQTETEDKNTGIKKLGQYIRETALANSTKKGE